MPRRSASSTLVLFCCCGLVDASPSYKKQETNLLHAVTHRTVADPRFWQGGAGGRIIESGARHPAQSTDGTLVTVYGGNGSLGEAPAPEAEEMCVSHSQRSPNFERVFTFYVFCAQNAVLAPDKWNSSVRLWIYQQKVLNGIKRTTRLSCNSSSWTIRLACIIALRSSTCVRHAEGYAINDISAATLSYAGRRRSNIGVWTWSEMKRDELVESGINSRPDVARWTHSHLHHSSSVDSSVLRPHPPTLFHAPLLPSGRLRY